MAAASTARRRPAPLLGLPPRYAPVRRIARGGMSTVWCAEDTLLGREVAVKLLSGALIDDPAGRRRFEREARAAASLSHPQVVTIFDVGETADDHHQPYIVMEYLRGGTVGEALSDGDVPRELALRWISEAAAALDFAHERGVVHRDVKPGNLLRSERDALKVADFGIARIASEATITASGQLFGTAAYLSPEQARGAPATPAGDRYALAVVAYELLAGRRPFTGEGFAAQARAHMEDVPPPASSINPSLPAGVDAVLARGLAKVPEARWASCAAFAAALRHAVAQPPTVALRSAAAQTATLPLRSAALLAAPARRAPRAAAAAALLAGLIMAALIVLLASGGRQPVRSAALGRAPASRARAHRVLHHRTTTSSRPAAAVPSGAPNPPATPVSTASSSPDALQARGHSLLASGSPAAAIPVLRQAVAGASPGSLTYAYALYDLGHALRLAGDPAAAIPILQQRLRIPNQTAVVQQELALAQAAAGQGGAGAAGAPAPVAPAPPGPGHGNGNGNGIGKVDGKGKGHAHRGGG